MMRSSFPGWITLLSFTLLSTNLVTANYDLVARQATSTTNSSDIVTIQTSPPTSSSTTRYTNTTFTTTSSTTAPSDSGSSSTTTQGDLTSFAYSTYTIPVAGGGVTTSTAYSVAVASATTKAPSVQSAGVRNWRVGAGLGMAGLMEAGLVVLMGVVAVGLL